MNDKGMSLVELLAVLVILSIVATIGGFGVNAFIDSVKKSSLETKENLIVSSAVKWGEDNDYLFCDYKDKSDVCYNEDIMTLRVVNGSDEMGIITTVKSLGNYISLNEECENQESCLINDVTGENMNDVEVFVFKSDNKIYASLNFE